MNSQNSILENDLYLDELKTIGESISSLGVLRDKTILISGATGMIGSELIDAIFYLNNNKNLNITVIALGRDQKG